MSTDVERVLYGDRTITSRFDRDAGTDVAGWPDVAYEAIRGCNHITQGATIPAPVAYAVLGNLTGMAGMLPQLCQQLAHGLRVSLDEFDVYDHSGNPPASVDEATIALMKAAEISEQLAAQLGAAQVAINSQGYNESPS
jgi:hypothetical protein